MLTAPRVYFAMAEDGLFFRRVAKGQRDTRVPVVAIVLQGVAAAVIALSGTFGQILNYVVSVDFIFFGLTGAALFVFRRARSRQHMSFRRPGHPFTTVLFVARLLGSWSSPPSATTPLNSLIGYAHPRRGHSGMPLLATQERAMAAAQGDAVGLHALGEVQAARALSR